MTDARTQELLDRLYAEDARQRDMALPTNERTRNLTRESGRFLAMYVRATGARRVVEVGSSNGVSTLWLASALRDTGGYVTGTELVEDRVIAANAHLRDAGPSDHGSVLRGDARRLVSRLGDAIDLVFIDAEKDDYTSHFDVVFPLVRAGGSIIADNVTSHDCTAYQAMLRGRDDCETITLPIERGLELTVKLA